MTEPGAAKTASQWKVFLGFNVNMLDRSLAGDEEIA
jgi:hypothetical protein